MSAPPRNPLALWTADDAGAATGGHSTAPWTAHGVSIDTRTIEPGDLFVALKGERFDAHDFVTRAFEAGAAAAMVSRKPAGHLPERPLLIVDDTYVGLRKLAKAARQRSRARVIAITGSVGKTSTKEALAAALAPSGLVTASRGNLNNHVGVPLSLARMHAESRFAVFEIGMNHAGEITPLSRMVRPDIAVITAIEAVHTEFFDSVDEIALAKAEIFEGLPRDGAAVLNRDNRYFDLLAAEAREHGLTRIVSFGEHEDADARLVAFSSDGVSKVRAVVFGQALDFTLALPGRHSAQNAMSVLAAVALCDADLAAAARALGEMTTPAGRGKRVSVSLPDGGTVTVIDDSYNASPASMRAAFRVLAETTPGPGGRRIAVLGDMLELGSGSARAHEALAEDIEAAHVDLVLTTGTAMLHLHDALPRRLRGGHTARAQGLIPILQGMLRAGDVVLVKASNSQRLGQVVSALATPKPTRKAANGD